MSLEGFDVPGSGAVAEAAVEKLGSVEKVHLPPDDSGVRKDVSSTPDDSGVRSSFSMPPSDSGEARPQEVHSNTFHSLNDMKDGMNMNYSELKSAKPPHSPNLSKWYDNGGAIRVDENNTWSYIDAEGREVPYIDGYPRFPAEAKNSVIDDISIGKFTGDRNLDKQLYLERLSEDYGLTEIPDGYALHHDVQDGNMQLIKMDWHKEFTHAGGHSLFKEAE